MTLSTPKGRPHAGILALAIALAVVAAYSATFRNGFVWNDSDYVTRPELQSVAGLIRIWTEPGATEQYYPLLHTAFWVEHRLWGDDALGYHLLNVALHAANALWLFFILRRLAVPGAWVAGLLYGVHPVTVESVAWISEQKNTLSTCFFLASAFVYLGRTERFNRGRYANASALFLFAILSKSVVATLPAALLVILWWLKGALSWRRDILPLVPWFIAGGAVGLFTAHVERASIGAEGPAFAFSLAQRTLVAGHAIWFYLVKDLWPSPLIFMYPRWEVDSSSVLAWAYCGGLLLVLGVLFMQRGKSRGALALALLFVGLLFPVLGFFNVYAFVFSFVADHFQYLACMVIFTGIAVGFARWAPNAIVYGAVAVSAGLGVETWCLCGHYRDSQSLYRSTIAENPDCWLAQYNLANLLRDAGKPAEAELHYREALRADPDHQGAAKNLGLTLLSLDRPAEAAVRNSNPSLSVSRTLLLPTTISESLTGRCANQ